MSAHWLVIDLGNSRLKWAIADAAGLRPDPPGGALPWPDAEPPWADWQALRPTGVALASVAGAGPVADLESRLAARLRCPVRRPFVQARWQGLLCAYPQPERLGIDRWLALIAAHRQSAATPVLVASAGTALTIDRLDPGGRHAGGLIAPGLAAMRAGLELAAPGLARFAGGQAGPGLATDSADAIASGCLQAAAALLERCRNAGPDRPPWPVLLSGGDAGRLRPLLAGAVDQRPRLVLEGLARWAFTPADTRA
jgi:type III pantothenate kinase